MRMHPGIMVLCALFFASSGFAQFSIPIQSDYSDHVTLSIDPTGGAYQETKDLTVHMYNCDVDAYLNITFRTGSDEGDDERMRGWIRHQGIDYVLLTIEESEVRENNTTQVYDSDTGISLIGSMLWVKHDEFNPLSQNFFASGTYSIYAFGTLGDPDPY